VSESRMVDMAGPDGPSYRGLPAVRAHGRRLEGDRAAPRANKVKGWQESHGGAWKFDKEEKPIGMMSMTLDGDKIDRQWACFIVRHLRQEIPTGRDRAGRKHPLPGEPLRGGRQEHLT